MNPNDTMSNPSSRVERVAYRGKETTTKLLTADDLTVYTTSNGGLALELHRYDADGKRAVESYRLVLCPEDKERVQQVR